MSCLDVMYQPFSSGLPTYSKSCSSDFLHAQNLSRSQDSLELGTTSSYPLIPQTTSVPSLFNSSALLTPSSGHHHSSPSSSPVSSSSTHFLKDDHCDVTKEHEVKSAQYLTSNCVLYSYFAGDTTREVDTHFSRSLSHPGSPHSEQSNKRDHRPMTARKFPPSFWNSHYVYPAPSSSQYHHLNHNYLTHYQLQQHPHHNFNTHGSSSSSSCDVGSSHHPYFPALQGLSNFQSDPWSYSFSSSSSTMPYPHRPMPYDLSYTPSSRLGQNYSSFLMQPSSMRSVTGHSDVSKPTEHSRSRFGDPYSSHSTFSALEAAGLQEAAKDLYWF